MECCINGGFCVVVSGLAVSRGLVERVQTKVTRTCYYKGMLLQGHVITRVYYCKGILLQGYNVPPDMTMLAYKSRRMSTSHFMMVWKVLQETIVVCARKVRWVDVRWCVERSCS